MIRIGFSAVGKCGYAHLFVLP